MDTLRHSFLNHLAQTSDFPLLLEFVKAEGIYLYDKGGKKYIDLISGIAVSNVGHRHPKVVEAIKNQIDEYMHLMVYGEYVQSPQVKLAKRLVELLPSNLDCVYFVNSGSEAIEGAMKLAKRVTGRSNIIAFKNAYHGSTQGALSIGGNEEFKQAFRPLLPSVYHLEFNSVTDLDLIDEHTACVVAETIQGEAGAIVPTKEFMKRLRKRCTETGTLLIIDEIQTGFGRTGSLFSFSQFVIIPDILCIAKAMGGGLPIGAFISSRELMGNFKTSPVLGHITTFGGNAVCCAASLAALNVLIDEKLIESVAKKEELFRELLNHKAIKSIDGKGLLLAIEFETEEINKKVITECINKGVITDWFLFAANKMRIAPPLTITEEEIKHSCELILNAINTIEH
jgi:acetylornithine/succinyldiaminopimelate/putrescine aminotransferase